jgi:hypothetical protein
MTQTLPKYTFIRGDLFSRIIKFRVPNEADPTGADPDTYPQTPFDLSGFEIFADIRDTPDESGTLYARLELGDGFEVMGADNDDLGIVISKEKSNAFIPNTRPFTVVTQIRGTTVNAVVDGLYYCDIRLVVNDAVKTFLNIPFEIVSNITQIP